MNSENIMNQMNSPCCYICLQVHATKKHLLPIMHTACAVCMLSLYMHCGMGGYYTWHAKWSAQKPAGEGGTSAFAPPAKLLVSLIRAIAGGEGQGAFMSQPLTTAITASLHVKPLNPSLTRLKKHVHVAVTNM